MVKKNGSKPRGFDREVLDGIQLPQAKDNPMPRDLLLRLALQEELRKLRDRVHAAEEEDTHGFAVSRYERSST